MQIEFIIPGEIRGKERPRAGKYHFYTPRSTEEFECYVRQCYVQAVGKTFFRGPVQVHITVYRKIPKSWSRKRRDAAVNQPCITKPDADNVIKSILDALNGTAYQDDAAVYSVTCEKLYTAGYEHALVSLEGIS